METQRAAFRQRSPAAGRYLVEEAIGAGGYLLVEAIVGVVLLGVGALGVAAALGQAEQLAARAVQREVEAGLRADVAVALAFGTDAVSGWRPIAEVCWRRVSRATAGFLWIEARCGVGAEDLPAPQREPGLLVRR